MTERTEPRDSAIIRTQIHLLSMVEGSLQASVLFALLRLRVPEAIGVDERTAGELADATSASPPHLARLLNAGVSAKLLTRSDDGRYAVAEAFRPLLVDPAGEHHLADYLRYLDYLTSAVARLDEAVAEGLPTADLITDHSAQKGLQETFTLGMHNYAAFRGREIVEHLDLDGVERVLDLGCGPGTYSFILGQHDPALALHLMDLPGALEVAKKVQGRYALENPVEYIPLDPLQDEIPGTYDLVLISNMIHMIGAEEAKRLLKKVRSALAPGGSVVIQAQYLGEDRCGGRWPVLLDLIMMCTTPDGANHDLGETRGWLEEAGFDDIETIRMSLYNTNTLVRGYRRQEASHD